MSFSEYEVEKIHENYQEKLYKKDMEIGNLQSIILSLGGHWEKPKPKNENECSACGGEMYTSNEHGYKELFCSNYYCDGTPPF